MGEREQKLELNSPDHDLKRYSVSDYETSKSEFDSN